MSKIEVQLYLNRRQVILIILACQPIFSNPQNKTYKIRIYKTAGTYQVSRFLTSQIEAISSIAPLTDVREVTWFHFSMGKQLHNAQKTGKTSDVLEFETRYEIEVKRYFQAFEDESAARPQPSLFQLERMFSLT